MRAGSHGKLVVVGGSMAMLAGCMLPSTGGKATGTTRAATAMAASSGSGGSGWTSGAPIGGSLDGIACSNGSDCVAVGAGGYGQAQAVYSTDAGATWSRGVLPPAVVSLAAVSCPSASDCVAVGVGLNRLTYPLVITSGDGGRSWVLRQTVGAFSWLAGATCIDALHCWATGSVSPPVISSTDGGVTWTGRPFPYPTAVVNGISCADLAHCQATGWQLGSDPYGALQPVMGGTADGGATWKAESLPSAMAVGQGVACAGPSNCVVVGATVTGHAGLAVTADGGTTWTFAAIPASVASLEAVTCPAPSTCFAVGSSASTTPEVIATANGGATWAQDELPASGEVSADAIACASVTSCLVAGNDQLDETARIFTTTDGGGPAGPPILVAPSPPPPPPPAGAPVPIVFPGDSTALTLAYGLLGNMNLSGVTIGPGGILGCGVVATGPYISHGTESGPPSQTCIDWQHAYAADVAGRPKVALLLIGRWETMTREVNGVWLHLGEPAYDRVVLEALDQAIATLGSTGAHVVLLSAPYYFTGYAPGGVLWPEERPQRVDELNRLIGEAAASFPGDATVIDLHRILSPGGAYVRVIDGVPVRSDGDHFTFQGALWLSMQLTPELVAIADGAAANRCPVRTGAWSWPAAPGAAGCVVAHRLGGD